MQLAALTPLKVAAKESSMSLAWLSWQCTHAMGQPLLTSSLPHHLFLQSYTDFLAQRLLFEDMSTTVYHNQQSRADTPSLRDSNSFARFW